MFKKNVEKLINSKIKDHKFYSHSYHESYIKNLEKDLKLLLDYLGLEIKDVPANRRIVNVRETNS